MTFKKIELSNFNGRKFEIDYYGLMNNDSLLIKKRPLILVFPGGGFVKLAGRESEPICFAYGNRGFDSAVVRYNVASDGGKIYPDAALSGLTAIKYFRNHAEELRIDTKKIVLIGFSAGAHVVTSINALANNVKFQKKYAYSSDEVKFSAMILGYPLIDLDQTNVKLLDYNQIADDKVFQNTSLSVDSNTPSTYIFQSVDDPILFVSNSLEYIEALKNNQVPFEAHLYNKGGHGYSLALPELKEKYEQKYGFYPRLNPWFDLSLSWLKTLYQ